MANVGGDHHDDEREHRSPGGVCDVGRQRGRNLDAEVEADDQADPAQDLSDGALEPAPDRGHDDDRDDEYVDPVHDFQVRPLDCDGRFVGE